MTTSITTTTGSCNMSAKLAIPSSIHRRKLVCTWTGTITGESTGAPSARKGSRTRIISEWFVSRALPSGRRWLTIT
jgi:hypothetical protein